MLRQVVNYFNERNSNVCIASLDAAEAFDRVKHCKLFSTFISNNLSSCFLKLIINWYLKMYVCIRWNGFYSSSFSVHGGVRQGSVLSPMLFNLYVNKFITCLKMSGAGRYFVNCYVGCIMYADDLLPLSGSVLGLQALLDTCGCVSKQLE